MNEKEEGILLGELKAFRKDATLRLVVLEKKVDSLDHFKMKVTIIGVTILGGIELIFRLAQYIHF